MSDIAADKVFVRVKADISQYAKRMRDADRIQQQNLGKMERQQARFEAKMLQSSNRMAAGMRRAFQGIAAYISVREVKGFFDEWTRGNNLLKSTEAFLGRSLRSQSDLADLALKTRSDLESTVSLYAKIARATKGRIKDEKQIARVVETVQKALSVGGASSSERASTVVQLGQALASGSLSGDELKSLRETSPVLMQAIADRFKTTISDLKRLGAEGKLTSQGVIEGILAGSAEVDRQFANTVTTMEQGIQAIRTAFSKYLNEAQEGFSVSEKIAWALGQVAENIDTVVGGFVNLAAVMASAKLGTYVQGLWDASKATAALGVSARAASVGLAALGGPVGLMITAVALLALNWDTLTQKIDASTDDIKTIESHLEDLREIKAKVAAVTDIESDAFKNLSVELEKATEKTKNLLRQEIARLNVLKQNLKIENMLREGKGEPKLATTDAIRESEGAIQRARGGLSLGSKEEQQRYQALRRATEETDRYRRGYRHTRGNLKAPSKLGSEDDGVDEPKGRSIVDFERERNREIEHRLDMIRLETDFMQRQVSLREQVAATYVAEQANAYERQSGRKLDPERDADLLARYRASGEELGAAREAQTLAQMRQEWNEALLVSKNRLKEERIAMEEGAEAARTMVLYQERLDQLRNAGINVTPDSALDKEIKSGAAEQAEIDTQTLERTQYRLRDAANELGESLRDTFGDALRGVENFEQGFIRALDNIAKKLVDNALLGLLGDFGFGDKKASGLFGAIGGLFGFRDGGVVKAYHSGGLVRGPGTGTSDSIPALLSNGEYVITKEAVDRIGINTLNMLNNISRFAAGGPVGRPRSGFGGGGLGHTTHIDKPQINITIESGAGENDEVLAQRAGQEVERVLRGIVREELVEIQRGGNSLGRER